MKVAVHKNTKCIVTGGSQGLGFAIAERLVAKGCQNIILAARDPEKGRHAAEILTNQGASVYFQKTDLSDTQSVFSMVDFAENKMGEVNALVNAGAITERGSILNTTEEEWDRFIATNARGPFFAIQSLAKRAIKAGYRANIVNILTMSSHCGQTFLAGYSASKATLSNITKNAALTLRGYKIRVNGINVGWMDTPGEDKIQKKWHGAKDDWLKEAEKSQPFGQLIKPEEVAGLVSYLLSDQSGVITGSVIDFDQNVAGSFPE